jgi:hypothetical protein
MGLYPGFMRWLGNESGLTDGHWSIQEVEGSYVQYYDARILCVLSFRYHGLRKRMSAYHHRFKMKASNVLGSHRVCSMGNLDAHSKTGSNVTYVASGLFNSKFLNRKIMFVLSTKSTVSIIRFIVLQLNVMDICSTPNLHTLHSKQSRKLSTQFLIWQSPRLVEWTLSLFRPRAMFP